MHGTTNVGAWKRTVGRDRVTVRAELARVGPDVRADVRAAADRLAEFLALPLDYDERTGG